MGAAYLAGIGGGLWAGEEEAGALWQPERVFEPGIGEDEREQRYALWKRAVERSRGWIAPDAVAVPQ